MIFEDLFEIEIDGKIYYVSFSYYSRRDDIKWYFIGLDANYDSHVRYNAKLDFYDEYNIENIQNHVKAIPIILEKIKLLKELS